MNEIQKTKNGIEKYLKIMDLVGKTNVAENEEFQHLFNGFYQVRRNKNWRDAFYSLLEEKKGKKPSIEEVMTYLAENTQRKSVELSFASKLLHTLDPTKPIYDKKVATFLRLESPPAYWSKEAKMKRQISNYNAIIEWYKTPQSKTYVGLFDKMFPEYREVVGEVKKIDFIIWRELSVVD